MKKRSLNLTLLCIGLIALHAHATTYYVDINSPNPTPPYTSWSTAATNIQDAVNQTVNGDSVLVNPGVYQSGGYTAPDGTLTAVVATNSVTLQSMNGAFVTSIDGSNAMRCVYLGNNSALAGFTIASGTTSNNYGGGVCCQADGNLNDCVINGNDAEYGGGVYAVYGCSINNCLITNNTAAEGGGVYCPYGLVNVNNCVIAGNTATNGIGGGGAYEGTLNNCLVISNSAPNGSGGGAREATLNSCAITGNEAGDLGGGVYVCNLYGCWVTNNTAYTGGGSAGTYTPSLIDNCLIANNSATVCGGVDGYAPIPTDTTLINCTVVNNTATSEEGGVLAVQATNSIIYDNFSPTNANYSDSSFANCCTIPSPGGTGNITNAPLLVSEAALNFQLQPYSPCINAGNNSAVSGIVDLAGNPRVIGGTVDLGAYEYQPFIVTISALYTNIVMGFSLQLQATVRNGTATFYSWNFGDGATSTNHTPVQHSWSLPGIYIVTLTVSNNIPTQTTTTYFTVNVLGPCYVNVNGTDPVPPYYSWATAATNIQDAVNAAAPYPGAIVIVTNGIYQSGGYLAPDGVLSAVVVTNSVTVESVNGSDVTSINGGNAMRCVYLENDAALAGFTIANGASSNDNGGGVYCQTWMQTISNCVVIGNSAYNGYGAGGVFAGTLYNCLVISNSAPTASGGGDMLGNLNNCILVDNTATTGGGCYDSHMTNCTVVDNFASSHGGGIDDFGDMTSTFDNCIIYDNSAPNAPNWYSGTYRYCCTTPLPGGTDITNAPLFVNEAAGDFQLQSNSPCINAGNDVYVTTTNDFAGNPRIIGGTVDMGAYEYQIPIPMTVAITTAITNVATLFPWQLQAIVGNGVPTTVLWDFGDGTTATNQLSLSHSWTSPGIYTVTVTVTNPYVPENTSASLMISVYQPTNFYVAVSNQAPAAPYVSWATAATNIQSVVSYASPASLILVSNGVYNAGGLTTIDGGTNRVAVTQPLTLQSVNGPTVTTIIGASTFRCVYLTNGAVLNGFTLTNGSSANGAGIYAASTNVIITNCIITHCSAQNDGGGTYFGTFYNCSLLNNSAAYDGGGACGGIFHNCTIANNSASSYGGGVFSGPGTPIILENCVIVSNSAPAGGGVFNVPSSFPAPAFACLTNCFLTNCVISFNSAGTFGNATVDAYLDNCTVNSNKSSYYSVEATAAGYLVGCTLIGNQGIAAEPGGSDLLNDSAEVLSNCTLIANGGGINDCSAYGCTLLQNQSGGALNSTLVDCLISSNSAAEYGGGAYYCTLANCSLTFNSAYYGGGAYQSTLVNCTVIANTAAASGGGVYDCTADNCIIYRNVNGDSYSDSAQYPLNYCCVSTPATYGIRNITNVPVFVAPLNFRLQSTSPCINSGNNAYISSATDLDGNPRIVGGTVDIGAYEYQTPTSVISYAYLQQYGLPTDGSVDFKDLDGTAFNVYQDWIAGLNPTNPASILAMFTPVTTATSTGVTVTWQSVSGIPYFLQRSTNLLSQPPFVTIQPNITGQANTTSYTDTSATNNVPYFYRVGITAP